MNNALDYIHWRSDLTFEASPINEVDIFLMSQFATPDFKGIISGNVFEISFEEACAKYFSTHTTDKKNIGVLQSGRLLISLKEASVSPRYKDLRLCGYIDRVQEKSAEQFSAVTIRVSKQFIVVAFMGTDDTLTGWKEDFNIAVQGDVPSQQDAKEYLEWAAATYPEARIGVCGHSKGGNLSLFSASSVPEKLQERIDFVYNLDGPGLSDAMRKTEGFLRIKDKVRTLVSKHTTIGTLMNLSEPVSVVETDATGMRAHDAFKWDVMQNHFVRAEKVSESSIIFGYTIKNTIEKLTPEEKIDFVEAFFKAVTSTGARTITDIVNTDIAGIFKALSKMGRDKRIARIAEVLRKEAESGIIKARKGELQSWESMD